MANYKQTTVAGDSWIRSNRVVIENPLNGVPNIRFSEEQVINIGTDIVKKHVSDVFDNLIDPSTTFNLIDPVTGLDVGTTVTYGQVYAILFSLYLDLANKRDLEVISETGV